MVRRWEKIKDVMDNFGNDAWGLSGGLLRAQELMASNGGKSHTDERLAA